MLATAQVDRKLTESPDLRELRRRMAKPQRHRLLHGYPLAAAMPSADALKRLGTSPFDGTTGRELLIGVLPHPFCNSGVKGCGFCTFLHEHYSAAKAAAVVERVIQDIQASVFAEPALYRRSVTGLYFGGGTANLTPAESFRALCRKLNAVFDLSGAEVTLEGVPAYFIKRKPLLLDILRKEIHARHFRISMGIQTFDRRRLRQMGRLAFGTRKTFREVVELAHSRGMTVSGDLLFNLPGQSLEEMRQDVREALLIGLDHLGLYHLVMFKGLRTAWSRDAALLASLPSNHAAADNWEALRELLQASGFRQTTLTNFERAEFHADARRFIYEESSSQPDRFEMLGFGPAAISFTADKGLCRAVKTLNPASSAEYMAAVQRGGRVWDRGFAYQAEDLKIFYLTRRLAALRIDRRAYANTFASDAVADLSREFEALQAEQLVEVTTEAIRPTPRGMFYADSIASLLAFRRLRAFRGRQLAAKTSLPAGKTKAAREQHHDLNSNVDGFM